MQRRPVLSAAALATLLAVFPFTGQLLGVAIFPWDFSSGYHPIEYQWVDRGGLLDPPGWFSSMWFGMPEHRVVQNAAWFVPVEIWHRTMGYTYVDAARLQVLIIGIGAAGGVMLWRNFFSLPLSVVLSVGYALAAPVFSNAQHSDVVRGYVLLPLLLAVLAPRWLRRGVWAWAVAAIVAWQVAAGSYPGVLVINAYVVLGFVVYWWWVEGRRVAYAAAVGGVAVVAALLVSPKYLPIALDVGEIAVANQNVVPLSIDSLATLVMPYTLESLPYDVTMRSVFIAAPLLAFAVWGRPPRPMTVLVGWLLGVFLLAALPGGTFVDVLPGMELSRFRTMDARSALFLALLLLAGSALTRLLGRDRPGNEGHRFSALSMGFSVAALACIAAVSLAVPAPPAIRILFVTWYLLWAAISVAAVVRYRNGSLYDAISHRDTAAAALVGVVLIAVYANVAVMAASGLRTWNTAPDATAEGLLSQPIEDAIAEGAAAARGAPRPARERLPDEETTSVDPRYDVRYARFVYEYRFGAYGYVNNRGSSVPKALAQADQEGFPELEAFLLQPARMVAFPEGTDVSLERFADMMASDERLVTVTPLEYWGDEETWQVEARTAATVVQNEIYAPGWTAEACYEDESCTPSRQRGWVRPC